MGGEALIERAAPMSDTFRMEAQDRRGLVFVIFREMTRFGLTGLVHTSALERDSLEVQLAHADNEVLKTIKLPLSRYFEFSDLPEGEYTISLHSSRLSKDRGKWSTSGDTRASLSLGRNAPVPPNPLELSFQATRKVSNEDIKSSSFGTFMLLAVAVFSLVNGEFTRQIVAHVVCMFQSRASSRDVDGGGTTPRLRTSNSREKLKGLKSPSAGDAKRK